MTIVVVVSDSSGTRAICDCGEFDKPFGDRRVAELAANNHLAIHLADSPEGVAEMRAFLRRGAS